MADMVIDKGEWYFDASRRAWCLTKAGPRYTGGVPEIVMELNQEEVRKLVSALDEAGWIKPRLDERLRVEDLKITHRLLDIIEYGGPK